MSTNTLHIYSLKQNALSISVKFNTELALIIKTNIQLYGLMFFLFLLFIVLFIFYFNRNCFVKNIFNHNCILYSWILSSSLIYLVIRTCSVRYPEVYVSENPFRGFLDKSLTDFFISIEGSRKPKLLSYTASLWS